MESASSRPVFRQMLDDAHAHKFDVVVTHTLDRLSRNMRVTLDAFHTFAQNDVAYVSITQEIDYSKPEGKLFMIMLGAFAQYYSDALSGHTKKGMQERAHQGLFNGEPPFGYERCNRECLNVDADHTGCHIQQDKAPKIVELFERYASGTESMQTLARWLNDQGYRTNGKRKPDILEQPSAAPGRYFTPWSIRDILKSPFYTGKVRHKETTFDGKHRPIIAQELFDEVQERIAKNRSRLSVSASKNNKNSHLLAGLLRCDECGTILWSQKQGAGRETYYKSPNKGLMLSCKYLGRSFLGRTFHAQTDTLFKWFRLRDDWKDWVIENYVEKSNPESALRQRRDIQAKVKRARNVYINGDLDWHGFMKIREQADADLVRIHVPGFDDAVEAGKALTNFGDLWQSASVGQRNRMLHTMLQAIYVDLDKREIVGLLPKKNFLGPILSMAERADVTLQVGEGDSSSRNGGDGGGHVPEFPTIPIRVEFKDTLCPNSATRPWFRERRLALGISQSKLAKLAGVHVKSVQAWESGRSAPRFNRRLLLGRLLKVPVATHAGPSLYRDQIGPSS